MGKQLITEQQGILDLKKAKSIPEIDVEQKHLSIYEARFNTRATAIVIVKTTTLLDRARFLWVQFLLFSKILKTSSMNIIMQTKKFESSTNTVWIGGPRDSLNTELSEGFEFIEFFMGTFVALKNIFSNLSNPTSNRHCFRKLSAFSESGVLRLNHRHLWEIDCSVAVVGRPPAGAESGGKSIHWTRMWHQKVLHSGCCDWWHNYYSICFWKLH